MIDQDGYRLNVAMVLVNNAGRCWLGKRKVGDQFAWQFPQGGLEADESPEAAMRRELLEEVGLEPGSVAVRAQSQQWISYDIPAEYSSKRLPNIRGQKQKWFLLQLLADAQEINLQSSKSAEFIDGFWVSYWYPLSCVVGFKRAAYREGLAALAPEALSLNI